MEAHMACTTILVGKAASFDGSTIIARNEDSPSGVFCPKNFTVVTLINNLSTTNLLFLTLK